MNELKNAIKIAVVATVITSLIGGAFAIGYRVGSRRGAQSTDGTADSALVEQTLPQAQPTASVSSTPSPVTGAALPNDTPPPVSTSPAPLTPEPPTTEPSGVEPTPVDERIQSDREALHILHEVWDLVDVEFYGELPSPEEREYSAIRGMLGTLDDDYTSFSEPSLAEIRRTDASGAFEGIGAFVTMNDEDILEIVSTFQNSPAEAAGLRPNDRVLAVDGQSIIGYSIYDAISLIRGPEGTDVVLTIQRGDAEPFDIPIVRARLDIPILESRMIEEKIGYVHLLEFSSPATSRLEKAIDELLDEGATALVLDLRSNPGGYLDQAVKVSDLFLDEGLVLIERRSDGQEIEFTSTDEGLAQNIQLVVLVNGGSASASEIVAGAIQDRGRGQLIGEMTFGKGSVQLLHELSDGSELRVTVARWFTPNDRAIHGEGLTPDIEVEMTTEDVAQDRDPQLDRAVMYLRAGQ